jgi:hypothetical protein
MARQLLARLVSCALLLLTMGVATAAHAQPAASPPSQAAAPNEPTPAPRGLAVVALEGMADSAWPLARAVYADNALRPAWLDEEHARVLAGEPASPSAARDLVELAQTRAAIHGDDAPSRQLLSSLCVSLHVLGAVVVESGHGGPEARVFVASTSSFDAASYAPDAPAPSTWGTAGSSLVWANTVGSLRRAYAAADAKTSGTAPAAPAFLAPVAPAPPRPDSAPSGHTPFYLSPWFWGAVGAAAFGAAAIYFATRDNGSDSIHLQVQVPR